MDPRNFLFCGMLRPWGTVPRSGSVLANNSRDSYGDYARERQAPVRRQLPHFARAPFHGQRFRQIQRRCARKEPDHYALFGSRNLDAFLPCARWPAPKTPANPLIEAFGSTAEGGWAVG